MSLPRRDKKVKIQMPVCPYCSAVAKHYGWQCPLNPKNVCKYCGGADHSSLMCLQKPRVPISRESAKKKALRTAVSKLWFELNPPDENGYWHCYLNISPDCPRLLTRATLTLEHVKSRVRHPELRYDVSNIKPACFPCNNLKGSLEVDELHLLSSVRVSKQDAIEARKAAEAKLLGA